ncbi:auxin efflux carrier [Wolfiporia cocos MD-104 SS10]|uniref:Auxin efflux carrier n=1 Tax=Wolfiporia cocos (strain MD-104) TaxID=742152 RepID=A0A2H3JPK7_WOLCO|nr:auxin efflux carrier [Wolfiporia cocos MD-104 SS10]
MATAGYLIYCGVMPLLKTFVAIFVGYFLAKAGRFSAEASKGASQVSMNVSLPALIFTNVVPAFTSSNVSALGPLFLTAFSYQLMGFSFGLIIREIFYVPRNFWQGIVVLCGMSNWGNLPNAIVSSIMQQAPFDPKTDPELGVSFVSIFIVSYHLVFWVAGAARSLAWDYLPGVPQGEEAERQLSWKEKPIGGFIARRILRLTVPSHAMPAKLENSLSDKIAERLDSPISDSSVDIECQEVVEAVTYDNDPDIQLARRTSRLSVSSRRSRHPSALNAPSSVMQPVVPPAPSASHSSVTQTLSPTVTPSSTFFQRLRHTLRPLSAAVTPITCSLAISLPIALITDLKALFVNVTDQGGPDWHGPDGNPPLAFVMDTTSFIGDMAVPLSLIILGGSFARLKIPRPFSRLPIAAMLAAAFAKMVLLPVIGVFMIQAMTKGGLIPREAIAERFVAMFLSGTPAAVNQLIVSSLYSPDGDVDTLSAFLLVQYVVMFFSSAALSAVALLLL